AGLGREYRLRGIHPSISREGNVSRPRTGVNPAHQHSYIRGHGSPAGALDPRACRGNCGGSRVVSFLLQIAYYRSRSVSSCHVQYM
ncbi:unnamed protein product, partial [Sphacelaria rigidula]